jgi:hypothetical protein
MIVFNTREAKASTFILKLVVSIVSTLHTVVLASL